MLSPERATVSITPAPYGAKWKLDQIKGKFNNKVSKECDRFVMAWLKTAQRRGRIKRERQSFHSKGINALA